MKKVKAKKTKTTGQKVREAIEGQSFVKVEFGGRKLVDKYFIWLLVTLAIVVIVAQQLVRELATVGQITSASSFKMDYENITSLVPSKTNEYLNSANAKEIYEKVVTHGPLDIKLYVGNLADPFNSPDSTVPLVKEYFKTDTFCNGVEIILGVNDLLTGSFAPNGTNDAFKFDICSTTIIEGVYFNVWSMSIEQ